MKIIARSLWVLSLGILGLTSCGTQESGTSSDPYLNPGSHPVIASAETALTNTESGDVIGYLHKGVYIFKGIPYAKAERFMPPQPPDPWEGVRSSRSYGPVCPIDVSSMILWDEMEFAQQHNFWFMKEEDCLNLNVWSPGLRDGKKRPVMVWLHGGGYTAGSSCELPTYDGESLSAGGDVKWVRANIENFGGDPGNVTIFGQSGGAGKVATLMYAPSARGLFHKAIMQSGGKPNFRDPEQTRKVGLAVLEVLGLSTSEVDKLKEIPHDELLAAGNKAIDLVQGEAQGLRMGWAPVLDGEFLPYQTGDPRGDAISRDIPLMIGTTRTEFAMSSRTPFFNGTREEVIEHLRETYKDQTDAYVAAFDKAYPNTRMPSDMMDVDFMFRPGSLDFANIKSSLEGGAPAYMYLFAWDAPILDGMLKSGHCMEIAFVFNNIHRNEEYNGGTPEAYALAGKVSATWASFARTGDPNNSLIPRWDPYTEESGVTLIFDNTIEARSHHDKELMEIGATPSLF
jgi:para-nitrobenzyl esterase